MKIFIITISLLLVYSCSTLDYVADTAIDTSANIRCDTLSPFHRNLLRLKQFESSEGKYFTVTACEGEEGFLDLKARYVDAPRKTFQVLSGQGYWKLLDFLNDIDTQNRSPEAK